MSPSSILAHTTLLLWLLIVSIADTNLYFAIRLPQKTLSWLGLCLFLIAIHILWLLLAHMLANALIRLAYRKNQDRIEDSCGDNSSVAILLCTRDDWIPSVASSCLFAMRGCDHMYICDDSESMESRHQIDKFVEFVADKCTVIRRENLKGWKAGNLNHCLYLLPKNFPYFMVVDHDNHVCPGMIQHAIGRFNRNPNLAFVQFPLEENCDSNTSFADDFQFSTRSVWWTLSIREKHGFRFNVGHTVLFRNEHVRKVEGFPENVLTEDLAITMRLLNHGYAGEYDLSITARESVPHTYQRYRSRHIRWCIGTSQSWLNPSVRLSKKRNPLSIIFDASLLSMQLLYSFPFLIMSLGLGLASHDLSYSITHAGLFFKMVTILSLLCPNLPLLCVARKSGKAIRLLAVNTAVYLSIIVPSVVSVLSALLSRRADFINTGNRVVSNKWNINQPIYRSFTANGPGTIFIECVVAFWFMLHIKNVGLQGLPIFMGIICGPIFTFFEWDSLLVKVAKYLPLLFIFISFILMLYQL